LRMGTGSASEQQHTDHGFEYGAQAWHGGCSGCGREKVSEKNICGGEGCDKGRSSNRVSEPVMRIQSEKYQCKRNSPLRHEGIEGEKIFISIISPCLCVSVVQFSFIERETKAQKEKD
jgi:hypothetical protein